jgi:hypothetical protein
VPPVEVCYGWNAASPFSVNVARKPDIPHKAASGRNGEQFMVVTQGNSRHSALGSRRGNRSGIQRGLFHAFRSSRNTCSLAGRNRRVG